MHCVAVTLFQRVVADDAESYLCYARNKFGSNSATGELVVLSKIFVLFFVGDDDGGGGVDDKNYLLACLLIYLIRSRRGTEVR